VVGVLLALWAQEWVEGQREKRDDKLALAAVRAETLDNLRSIAQWTALGECHRDEIAYIRDQLLRSRGEWPGINRRAAYFRAYNNRLIPGFYTIWTQRPKDLAWQAAIRSGTVDRMPEQDRDRAATAYSDFMEMAHMMDDARAARSQLSGLVYSGQLSSGDRTRAFNQLAELDNGREYLGRYRDYTNFDLTKAEAALLEKWFKEDRDGMASLGELRPCYDDHPAKLR